MKRQMSVRPVPYEAIRHFILSIHYARRKPVIQYAFGLFDGDLPDPVGVVTYGQPATPAASKWVAGEENRKHVLELNRLVLYPEYNGGNYGSYLVSRSLKLLPHGTFVISYADWGGWHHIGYVYQATNWLYTGLTKAKIDKYSTGKHPRHRDLTDVQTVLRTEKHRYVYLVGTRREVREMRKKLRYPVIGTYPKGQSVRYDLEKLMPFADGSSSSTARCQLNSEREDDE